MWCRRVTVTREAAADQLAVADAARAEFESVWKKAMARAAFDLLLEVDPGSYEAQWLHERIQSVVDEVCSPRSRVWVSTHEFNAVCGVNGEVVTGSVAVDARISEWMCDLHKGRAGDPRFSVVVFQSLQGEHARWESELRGAEYEAPLARAADARRWDAFRDEAGEEEAEEPDRDLSGFLASGPTVHEVKEMLQIIDAGLAPSPLGGVVGQAL